MKYIAVIKFFQCNLPEYGNDGVKIYDGNYTLKRICPFDNYGFICYFNCLDVKKLR